jgi:putative Mn2+ efflux pump MntP
LLVGGAFGFAQALGPVIGFVLGAAFAGAMATFDHWVAFGILSVLGGKLLHEGLTKGPEDEIPRAPARGWVLLGLAVATSIDAVAAGVALPTMGLEPLRTAALIGVVTMGACYAGVLIGRGVGGALGGKAEVFGGTALIGLGIKTLMDHGAFG